MSFTPREYPTAEIAIALWSMAPERIQEGDIVTWRRPDIGVGLQEHKLYLWMLVDGFEISELPALKMPVWEPFDPTGEYEPSSAYTRYDKRRYNIPLTRLQTVYPALDLNRCRDPNDGYQPFYTIDTDNHLWLTDTTPFQATGLIFDRVEGVYL